MESGRRTIAREMLTSSQLLTGLKMEVSIGAPLCSRRGHGRGRLAICSRKLKHIMTVVRQVAGNLRPPVLELGLYAGIEMAVDEFPAPQWRLNAT